MKMITPGKIRGLQQLSNPDGTMTVLALDQRGSLIKALGLKDHDPDVYQKVRDFKLEVIEYLLPHCSAILLDPQFSAAEALTRGLIPGSKGLILATEESGYVEKPDGRINQVIPGWSLGKAKRMGASAAKLLAYYNPNIKNLAAEQIKFINSLAQQAQAVDLPLLVEPMSYSVDPQMPKNSPAFAKIRPEIVKTTAEQLGKLDIDILKLEFPCDFKFEQDNHVWETACAGITETSPVPWLLLSAGVDFPVFRDQVEVACRTGASGFVAGRAIWKEAAQLTGKERTEFLRNTAVDRVKILAELVSKNAASWLLKTKERIPSIDQDWLTAYQDFE
jgi:tagatose 1,6-diphosphate aldolase